MTTITPRRLLLLIACLAVTGAFLWRSSRAEAVPIRESLATCPVDIASWNGRSAAPLDERTLAVLGVDEYLHRLYLNRRGAIVSLYVGYYGSQRQGDTIHSPLNCLPGAGWMPVKTDRIDIPIEASASAPAATTIRVNRFVIERGLDRNVVLYWYQSHGRVVASEYLGRFYMVLDAIRTNRTDGALVRVISPIIGSEDQAERDAVDFVRSLFPLLSRYLPA